jgi:hypothetical protein
MSEYLQSVKLYMRWDIVAMIAAIGNRRPVYGFYKLAIDFAQLLDGAVSLQQKNVFSINVFCSTSLIYHRSIDLCRALRLSNYHGRQS